MAIIQDTQQFDIEHLSTDFGPRQKSKNVRQNEHRAATRYNKENIPLLGSKQHGCYARVRSKFRSHHCCLCSSKAALLVLDWNLIVSFCLVSFLDPNLYTSSILNVSDVVLSLIHI